MQYLRKSSRRMLLGLSVVVLVVGLLALPAAGRSLPAGAVDGRYIVVFDDSVTDVPGAARALAVSHGMQVDFVYQHALKGMAGYLPAGRLAALERDPRVAYVEPDLEVKAYAQTLPTGIDRVEADQNGTARIDGVDDRVDVDIAIIDTGIDLDHPDLNVFRSTDCAWGGPFNSSCRDGDGDDGNGHGTHVAGTAAALDNGIGVVGMAPGARLWAVRVLDNRGSGYMSWIIAGVDWVTSHASEIEVANMSLGGQGTSSALHTAIQNSVARGVLYAVAAGNDTADVYGPDGTFGTGDDFIPAAYPEVATISALSDTDGRPGGLGAPSSWAGSDRNADGVDDGADDSFAFFSNYSRSVVSSNPVSSPGAAIDLLMPGVDIYSTWPGGGYNTISGTSMASPHGAGLAALYIAANGRATDAAGVYAIRQALINAGVAQTGPNGLTHLNDPDGNLENIGWAAP